MREASNSCLNRLTRASRGTVGLLTELELLAAVGNCC